MQGHEYAGQQAYRQGHWTNGVQNLPNQYQYQYHHNNSQSGQPVVVLPHEARAKHVSEPQLYSTSPHSYGQGGYVHHRYQPTPTHHVPYGLSYDSVAEPCSSQSYQQHQQYRQQQTTQYRPSYGDGDHQFSAGPLQSSSPHPLQPLQVHPERPQQRTISSRPTPTATSQQITPLPPSARLPSVYVPQDNLNFHSLPLASTPQQRVVSHVQIPIQRSTVASPVDEMARPAKRRRSNEGDALDMRRSAALSKPAKPQKPSAPRPQESRPSHQSSSPLTDLPSSQIPATPPLKVDYPAALLALADEYVSAAYRMTSSIAAANFEDEDVEQYHRLLTTAMGCLESVLKDCRHLEPRKEARIRLRLATLLHEETESSEVAVEVLSKGIALCDRNRLTDLKYAMHHVLVRITVKGNIKAGLKAIDKLIAEVEALKIPLWIYTFRLLRTSLGWRMNDTAASLRNLAAIQSAAQRMRHPAMQITAAALETATHLRSGALDAVELAQSSLAAARTHQLSPEMQQMPQLRALLDCLDLVCALMRFHPDQIIEKMQQMHANMDSATRDKAWNKHSSFVVSMGVPASKEIFNDTAGIVTRLQGGEAALAFDWIHKGQLYALGYLLSGVASSYKSSSDSKADKFLQEGLKLIKLEPEKVAQPLSALADQSLWRTDMANTVRLQLICAQCARSEWPSAAQALGELRTSIRNTDMALHAWTTALITYLDATCKQGEGNLKSAYELYAAPELDCGTTGKGTSSLKDLCIVATLNRVLVLRGLAQADEAGSLLATLETMCLSHENRAITAAYYILRATTQGSNTAIIKIKQNLQSAVQAAKAVANNQLLCVVMNLMTQLFFNNIVGEQAVKSARASHTLANKTQNKLWQAVADTMYGDTLNLCGEVAEAQKAWQEASNAMNGLPPNLQTVFANEE